MEEISKPKHASVEGRETISGVTILGIIHKTLVWEMEDGQKRGKFYTKQEVKDKGLWGQDGQNFYQLSDGTEIMCPPSSYTDREKLDKAFVTTFVAATGIQASTEEEVWAKASLAAGKIGYKINTVEKKRYQDRRSGIRPGEDTIQMEEMTIGGTIFKRHRTINSWDSDADDIDKDRN